MLIRLSKYVTCVVLKKYIPFIALIAAAFLFFWVKKNQRGPSPAAHVTIEPNINGKEPFTRDINHISYSKHARCRMDCRHIDEAEVKEVIASGEINYNKVEEDEKGKTYPLEGITHEKQHVRIVVAPHGEELVVVTVIDLDVDWKCNCY